MLPLRVLCLLSTIVYVTSDPLPFDGLIRAQPDGSYIAYMNPPGAANHASFLEQFPTNSGFQLGLAWFSGAKEEADKCAIVYSMLPQNSNQWTDPITISVRDGYSNQNPVLFFDNTSSILHCFHSQAAANSGESSAQIWHLQSSNYGKNWTEPKALFTFPGAFPKNRIIPAMSPASGVIFPIYNAAKNTPLIAKSSDRDLGNKSSWTLYQIANANDLVQPSVIRLPGSYPKLKALFRDRRKIAIYQATSTDDGETWETPYSFQLPNPNVAIQANTLLPFQKGPIILLFNDYNGGNSLGRTPMSIGLSYDDGTTWPNIRMLQVHNDNASSIPVNGGVEYSYPSVLQTPDGMIHSSYTYNRQTIKYLKFNETWALVG